MLNHKSTNVICQFLLSKESDKTKKLCKSSVKWALWCQILCYWKWPHIEERHHCLNWRIAWNTSISKLFHVCLVLFQVLPLYFVLFFFKYFSVFSIFLYNHLCCGRAYPELSACHDTWNTILAHHLNEFQSYLIGYSTVFFCFPHFSITNYKLYSAYSIPYIKRIQKYAGQSQ